MKQRLNAPKLMRDKTNQAKRQAHFFKTERDAIEQITRNN